MLTLLNNMSIHWGSAY